MHSARIAAIDIDWEGLRMEGGRRGIILCVALSSAASSPRYCINVRSDVYRLILLARPSA